MAKTGNNNLVNGSGHTNSISFCGEVTEILFVWAMDIVVELGWVTRVHVGLKGVEVSPWLRYLISDAVDNTYSENA